MGPKSAARGTMLAQKAIHEGVGWFSRQREGAPFVTRF